MRQSFLGFTALLLACSADLTDPSAVASVTIEPVSGLYVGNTIRLTVIMRDAAGRELTNRPVVFSSSDVRVSRVSATGLVQALAVGTATITATSEGRSGRTTVYVVPTEDCMEGCWDYSPGVTPLSGR